jgi:hypothetical protein
MRVQGTAACTAFDRPNVVMERIQIQSAHKFPNAAGPVLWLDQLIDIDRPQQHLLTIDHLQTERGLRIGGHVQT